jgi:hypothetical protein
MLVMRTRQFSFALLRQRVRGLAAATLIGSALWALLGLTIGLALKAAILWSDVWISVSTEPNLPGGLPVVLAVTGAIVGAMNGLALGLLLLTTERGHSVEDIPYWRFGIWGALATGLTGGLVTQSAGIGLLCAALGAATAVLALGLAKRASPPTADA